MEPNLQESNYKTYQPRRHDGKWEELGLLGKVTIERVVELEVETF